jgi:hypothetical protein
LGFFRIHCRDVQFASDVQFAFIGRLGTKKVKMQSYNKINVAKEDVSLHINNLNSSLRFIRCLPFTKISIGTAIKAKRRQTICLKSNIKVLDVKHSEILSSIAALELNFKQSIKPIAAAA